MRKLYFFSLLGFFLFHLTACQFNSEQAKKDKVSKLEALFDLDSIKSRGSLKALIENSSTSYFVYKGQPMGFEYELLSRFTKEINVDLELIPIQNMDHVFDSLEELKGDVIAANLTVTKERKSQVEFSLPLLYSNQVLVQRNEGDLVRTPSQMAHKTIFVRKNSSFYSRLHHLSEEIGDSMDIQEVSGDITVEELIKQVAEGEIDYTVADRHVAKINQAFYRNLYTKTPVSLEQQIAWALRKNTPQLLKAINLWLEEFKKTKDFRVIYLKYYGNTKLYRSRVKSELFTPKSGQISPYDSLIKEAVKPLGWDWKLLSALIYQESGFNHYVESWAGAYGLMQLMPETAESFGVDSISSPEANVKAGVKYLLWLNKEFLEKVSDSTERVKFVLAAYNVGLGHVFDAIRLAEHHELNPEVWDKNVAEMLKNKSLPEYYKSEVVYYGYCRGSEPYKYVKEIFERYEHYLNMVEKEE